MCVTACLHVYMCTTCLPYPQRPEEGIRYPGTGVTLVGNTMWVLGITPALCKSIKGFLTSAPSLVPIFPAFETPPYWFPQWVHQSSLLPAGNGDFSFPTTSQRALSSLLFINTVPIEGRWNLKENLIFILSLRCHRTPQVSNIDCPSLNFFFFFFCLFQLQFWDRVSVSCTSWPWTFNPPTRPWVLGFQARTTDTPDRNLWGTFFLAYSVFCPKKRNYSQSLEN